MTHRSKLESKSFYDLATACDFRKLNIHDVAVVRSVRDGDPSITRTDAPFSTPHHACGASFAKQEICAARGSRTSRILRGSIELVQRASLLVFALATLVGSASCGGGWGSGTSWVHQPLVPDEKRTPMASSPYGSGHATRPAARTIGARTTPKESERQREVDRTGGGGRVVGTFRNTYYDFPLESDHTGPTVSLMNPKCESIAQVPRGFFEAVCVQGSGALARGTTVSFGKRDCACAEICPRTNQRICFEALDKAAFPWGRGASGNPITPLRSVAADTRILAMGTVIYVPELDGISADPEQDPMDGCFVVEDRGLKVQGEHIDIFTGHPSRTAVLNAQVPSNQGVTVIVDTPKCAHLAHRR